MAQLPHPESKDWPAARDAYIRRHEGSVFHHLGFQPLRYQYEAQFPVLPYSETRPGFRGLFGAKRIGKSIWLGARSAIGAMIPGYQCRLFGPEYENTEREFRWLNHFLFTGPKALVKTFPILSERLTYKNLNPRKGALEITWGEPDDPYCTRFLSRSLEREIKWLGEPIDDAILCEPGVFPDSDSLNFRIMPLLSDKLGMCWAAGTPDNAWLEENIHRLGHDPENHPNIHCVCEIPRSRNAFKYNAQEEELARRALGESSREYVINWLGKWGYYGDAAYSNFKPEEHVRILSRERWLRLKRCPPGWEKFAALDTGGRYNACGQYVVNPRGVVLRIDEFTNYRYTPAGQIETIDDRGFRPWFADVIRNGFNGERPLVFVDPSSHFKRDLDDMGVPWLDAVNDHSVGVSTVNEHYGLGKCFIVRPEGNARTILEIELPGVRWRPKETGISGRATLARGKDHCADEHRYALVSRHIADDWLPEKTPTVIERDIARVLNGLKGGIGDEQEGAWY